MGLRLVLSMLILGGLVAAQNPPAAKCQTCNGAKQVKCFSCDGKSGAQVPCPACPDGFFPCPGCQGAGTLMCISCGGAGKTAGDALKCKTCGGDGKLDCLLCDKGNVPCTRCKGTAKVASACPTCRKSGQLRCPECSGYAAAEKCPSCNGTKREKCVACDGDGEQLRACDNCRGHGRQPCGTCYGHGRQSCSYCAGAGKVHKNGDASGKVFDQCDECHSKGYSACPDCKGKGLSSCVLCHGKGGAMVPCWWCAGAKTISCRRCIETTRCWTGKHDASGVTVTVLPCQDLEPQFSIALKEAASLADYRVWRVILDGREAKAPFQLGGGDGWTLLGVTPAESESATLDTSALFAPEVAAALARKLPSWGGRPDAFQSPTKVEPKEVKTRFLISDRALGTDAKAFRLRFAPDPTQVAELAAQPLTVDQWVALCVAAARDGRK